MPPLSESDRGIAVQFLLEAYARDEIDRALRERLNIRLEWAAGNVGFEEQLGQLIDYCARHRLTGQFLLAVAGYPPPTAKKAALAPLAGRYPPDPDEPPRPLNELVDIAVARLKVVPPLLAQTTVRDRFGPFVGAYHSAATHIDRLRRYKELHHCLHTVQLQYAEIARVAKALPDEPWEAGSLDGYADVLAGATTGTEDRILPGLDNPAPERTWVGNLHKAIDDLHRAAASGQPKPAKDALWQLKRILGQEPARIHTLLVNEFGYIGLPAIAFSLRAVRTAVAEPALQQQVADGMAHLEAVQLRLGRLVEEHTVWQNLDNSLRVAVESWYQWLDARRAVSSRRAVLAGGGAVWGDEPDDRAVYGGRLIEDWPDVAEKFAAVRGRVGAARPLDRLGTYAERLEKAAALAEYDDVFKAFVPFAQLALQMFVTVDRELLDFADDLDPIGKLITSISEGLRQ